MGYNFFFENFWFNIFLKHDSQSCDVFCIFRWATPLYVTLRVCPKVEFCLCILFVPTLFLRFNAPPPFVHFVCPHCLFISFIPTKLLGHRGTGTLEQWNTGTPRHFNTRTLDTRAPGQLVGLGCPPTTTML